MFEKRHRILILYDGDCLFCSTAMGLLLRRLRTRHRIRLCSVRSRRGRARMAALGLDPNAIETFVIIIDGRAYTRSDGVLRLFGLLGPQACRAAALGQRIPERWRDRAYDTVARNRFRFGRRRHYCTVPGEIAS